LVQLVRRGGLYFVLRTLPPSSFRPLSPFILCPLALFASPFFPQFPQLPQYPQDPHIHFLRPFIPAIFDHVSFKTNSKMAKQTSIITLSGNIGKLNFFKNRDGYQAREKGGVSKSRIMTDPRYARTRENIAEFTINAAAVKLLKDTIRPALIKISDPRLHQRLVRRMLEILRTDPVNNRGERQVAEGDWLLMQGLEMNVRANLATVLKPEITYSNTASDWQASIPAFQPADFVWIPEGATHFRIFAVGASVDFSTLERNFLMEASAELPIGDVTSVINLTVPKATLVNPHKVFLLGIEFLQLVNGQQYALSNGTHNAASIITAEKA
jgi:hypothetical protein